MRKMFSSSIKILLIEDDLEEIRLLKESLKGNHSTQFHIVHAKRLEDAQKHLHQESFDAILLDMTLPESDELASLNCLTNCAPKLPIIVLTNTNNEKRAIEAVRQGAQDYLVKQKITSEVFVRSLQYAIERKQISAAPQEANQALEVRVQERIADLAHANELLQQEVHHRQRVQEQLEMLCRASHKINTVLEISTILRTVVEAAMELVGATAGTAGLVIDGKMVFEKYYEQGNVHPIRASFERGKVRVPAQVLETMQPYVSNQTVPNPCVISALQQASEIYNLANIPIISPKGEFLGCFEIYNKTQGDFDEHDVTMLQSLATSAAVALENSRIFVDHQHANQKIQEQAALLDITADAVWVKDLNDRIVFWNQRAEQLYGWTVTEVIDKAATELMQMKMQPSPQAIQQQLLVQGEWQGEVENTTKDGKEILVQSRWTLMRDEEGKPKSVLVVNTDITERKQLEAQLLRAQRLESIGTLASGVAHDLNNILTPILAVAQLLPMKLPHMDENHRQMLQMLESSSKRGAEIVKQILSFARGVEGKHVPLQVSHLLVEIEKIVQRTFLKSINVLTNIPNDLWLVSADPTQLHQVLMNLCVNARDAMPQGGTLTIAAENRFIDENYARMHLDANVGSYVVVTVADTGTGIPQEIMHRIFDPFFTTKEVGHGTGLGLSAAIGIIRNHGGFIDVRSEVNKGTEFKVYLPVCEKMAPRLVPNSSLLRGKQELILLVDDEELICEVTKKTLETYNYRVLTANDGIEAVMLYAKHKLEVNAVLLDMMMPLPNGATTMRMLQKINSDVQIIAMSGLASTETIAQAKSIGAKNFLQKPFTAKQLLQVLHQLDSSQQSISQPKIKSLAN